MAANFEYNSNSARFLRKRILQHYKSENQVPEVLSAIWKVGAALWNKVLPEAYEALDAYQWDDDMKPLMLALKGNIWSLFKTMYTRREYSHAMHRIHSGKCLQFDMPILFCDQSQLCGHYARNL